MDDKCQWCGAEPHRTNRHKDREFMCGTLLLADGTENRTYRCRVIEANAERRRLRALLENIRTMAVAAVSLPGVSEAELSFALQAIIAATNGGLLSKLDST